MDQNCEQLFDLIRRRAENLFETHQLLCSEAVLYVLNEGLRGGLQAEFAVRLASGFGEGIGKTGCMCGAFSGAVMGLGLFLGRKDLTGEAAEMAARIILEARPDLIDGANRSFLTARDSKCLTGVNRFLTLMNPV